MATIQENALPSKSSIVAADKLRAIGSDSKSYQALVSDVAKYIVENYDGSTLAGSAQSVQAALTALNSNLVAVYSGTVSFTAIDPIMPNNSRGMGAWLDNKVHASITSFNRNEVISVAGVSDNVAYGALFFKVTDSYYAGIMWSYHANCRNTPWFFRYSNGTYTLRPLAQPIV